MNETASPVPSTIDVAVEAITVAHGGSVTTAVVLTNTTRQEVAMVLDDSCERLVETTYSIHDPQGRRVDSGSTDCSMDRMCSRSAVAIAIAANGSARVPFTFVPGVEDCPRATVADLAEGSHRTTRQKPLPRGTYDVKVHWNGRELPTKVTIR